MVADEPDLELLGVAQNVEEVISVARTSEPDVLLFDLEAVGDDDAHRTYEVSHRLPNARLVALSSYDDIAAVRRSFDAGYHRHVSKILGGADLVKILLEEHANLG